MADDEAAASEAMAFDMYGVNATWLGDGRAADGANMTKVHIVPTLCGSEMRKSYEYAR